MKNKEQNGDKKLRRMSRRELMETVRSLREENESLRQQLAIRQADALNANAMAEQLLSSLNQLLETAQAASDEYLGKVSRLVQETQDTWEQTTDRWT